MGNEKIFEIDDGFKKFYIKGVSWFDMCRKAKKLNLQIKPLSIKVLGDYYD